MRTRTNLHLDQDALELASFYAEARGISLGVAVSELIRRAEQAPEVPSGKLIEKNGFLVVKGTGQTITSEQVKRESEDDDEG